METQVWNAAGGKYYVKIVASNGLTLAHSETYASKQNAVNCAKLIAVGGTAVDRSDLQEKTATLRCLQVI